MAEEKDKDIIEAEFGDEEDQEVIFQIQMQVYDLFMRKWKDLIVGSAVVLVIVLIYSLYTSHIISEQQDQHAQVFDVKRELPEKLSTPIKNAYMYQLMGPLDSLNPAASLVQPQPYVRAKFHTESNLFKELLSESKPPKSASKTEKYRQSAIKLEKIAKSNTGMAASYAWLEVSYLWAKAGESIQQLVAIQNAEKNATSELMKWAVCSAKAMYHFNKGEAAKSIEVYQAFSQNRTGFFVQSAMLNIALIHEQSKDKEKSLQALADLITKFPEHQFKEEVEALKTRLGS